MQILSHTPNWVFLLFAALFAFGSSQLVTRQVPLGRVVGVALGMTGFGAFGVISVFSRTPLALLAAVATLVTVALVVSRLVVPRGTAFDPARRSFTVPGSVLPLVLMMGIFCTKFGVGVTLALHPELREVTLFAVAASALYGGFSGLFLGRAMRLLALRGKAPMLPQLAFGRT